MLFCGGCFWQGSCTCGWCPDVQLFTVIAGMFTWGGCWRGRRLSLFGCTNWKRCSLALELLQSCFDNPILFLVLSYLHMPNLYVIYQQCMGSICFLVTHSKGYKWKLARTCKEFRAILHYDQGLWLWKCEGPCNSPKGVALENWNWILCGHGPSKCSVKAYVHDRIALIDQ